jgi:hypothetical protein
MDIIIECPHCQGTVLVNKKDLNCMIFRHGILKDSGKQLDPHLPKKECDESTKNFLQNIASHALAIAAIKKDSSALGCIGNCSKTAMITLENKDLDLSILSLSNIKQKKEYKYLTSLIKERWVIGKKK